ncbi:calponin homology domain-containing protein [Pelagophyceae sp. CCMP2097]|nr:calponin homology domain-containing protein [Pelagophyceae sp. CCMP2097]|mmetsp:Transcript_20220/g.69423  ORF Transcript_20220/g.69423 Transcript_20220/m.69423 type:complete len:637 (-) Transcript_20220:46-1956(-)
MPEDRSRVSLTLADAFEGIPAGARGSDTRETVAAARSSLRPSDTDSWNGRFEVLYSRWINARLKHRIAAGEMDAVTDLTTDLRSGVVLYYLLEALTGAPLGRRVETRGRMQVHALSNLHAVFATLQNLGIKTVNIGANDVYSGNLSCIFGLLWTLMAAFAWSDQGGDAAAGEAAGETSPMATAQVGDVPKAVSAAPQAGALKRSTVAWARARVGSVTDDLVSSFRDGRAYAKLLQACAPEAGDCWDADASAADNLARVFAAADRLLGVAPLLDASDAPSLADERAVLAYLCEFRHRATLRESLDRASPPRPAEGAAAVDEPMLGEGGDGAVLREGHFAAPPLDEATLAEAEAAAARADEVEARRVVARFIGGAEGAAADGAGLVVTHDVDEQCVVDLKLEGDWADAALRSPRRSVAVHRRPPSDACAAPSSMNFLACMMPSGILDDDEDEEEAQSTVTVVVGVHCARALFSVDGEAPAAYCVVRHGAQEVLTRRAPRGSDAAWEQAATFDVALPTPRSARVEVFVFSAQPLFADELLGKAEILISDLLAGAGADAVPLRARRAPPPLRAQCLLDRASLPVLPCDTDDQDVLQHVRLSGARAAQRVNPMHDKRKLFKHAGYLGSIELSVFCLAPMAL